MSCDCTLSWWASIPSLVLIPSVLFEKWATLKFLHVDNNNYDNDLAITIAWLFLRNRQSQNYDFFLLSIYYKLISFHINYALMMVIVLALKHWHHAKKKTKRKWAINYLLEVVVFVARTGFLTWLFFVCASRSAASYVCPFVLADSLRNIAPVGKNDN